MTKETPIRETQRRKLAAEIFDSAFGFRDCFGIRESGFEIILIRFAPAVTRFGRAGVAKTQERFGPLRPPIQSPADLVF